MLKAVLLSLIALLIACSSDTPHSGVTDLDNFLNGKVVDSAGVAVSNVTIVLYKERASLAKEFLTVKSGIDPVDSLTSSDGTFEFVITETGYYYIIAFENSIPITYKDRFFFDGSINLELTVISTHDTVPFAEYKLDSIFDAVDSITSDSIYVDTIPLDTIVKVVHDTIEKVIKDSVESVESVTDSTIEITDDTTKVEETFIAKTVTTSVVANSNSNTSNLGWYYNFRAEPFDSIFNDTTWYHVGMHLENKRSGVTGIGLVWRKSSVNGLNCVGRWIDENKSSSDFYVGDELVFTTIEPVKVVIENISGDTIFIPKSSLSFIDSVGTDLAYSRNTKVKDGLALNLTKYDDEYLLAEWDFANAAVTPWEVGDTLEIFSDQID